MKSKRFKPIYGWGWIQWPENILLTVPELFVVRILAENENVVFGMIQSASVYAGMQVKLSIRSINPKCWNVVIVNMQRAKITGYAMSD